jgi:radical SAM-linked protein
MILHRVRIRFRKEGDLRLISHRDLMRTMERLFRRGGIVLCQSEGFHPKPRFRFASALGLGIEGRDEVLEVDLAEETAPRDLLAALNAQSPDGLSFHAAEIVPTGAGKAQPRSQTLRMALDDNVVAETTARVDEFLRQSSWLVERPPRQVDVRGLVELLEVEDGALRMKLRITREAGVRPRDVLEALGLGDWESRGFALCREALEIEE